jgi:hypothetical protein
MRSTWPADTTRNNRQKRFTMTKWPWLSQFGLAGFASLVFLTIVSGDLEAAERRLAARKAVWERRRRQSLEEESIQTVHPVDTPGGQSASGGSRQPAA